MLSGLQHTPPPPPQAVCGELVLEQWKEVILRQPFTDDHKIRVRGGANGRELKVRGNATLGATWGDMTVVAVAGTSAVVKIGRRGGKRGATPP